METCCLSRNVAFGFAASPLWLRRGASRLLPVRSRGSSTPLPRNALITSMAETRRMPGIVRPVVPLAPLREFVPDEVMPRSKIIKALSDYARQNGLQDPNNKSVIRCDTKLKTLLGVDTVQFIGISKYITPHISKPEIAGGKYVEQAEQYEKQWLAENANKPPGSKKEKKTKSKRMSAEEAKAAGIGLWAPVRISEDLAKICGNRREIPRQDIIKAVWTYIRLNNLQGKPGEPVRCDFLLRNVFHVDSISPKAIMGGVQPHIEKKK